MTEYVWTSDTPRVRPSSGDRYEKGDTIEPTDHELRAFGDRIEEKGGVDWIEDVDEGVSEIENGEEEPE